MFVCWSVAIGGAADTEETTGERGGALCIVFKRPHSDSWRSSSGFCPGQKTEAETRTQD